MAVRGSNRKQARRRNRGNLAGSVLIGTAIIVAGMLMSRPSTPVEASTAERIVAEYDTVDVIFTTTDVPAGTAFKEVRLKTVPYPKHQLLPGQVTAAQSSQYLHKITAVPLPRNFPILLENLQDSELRSNPVIDKIPEGYRAMTVKVDATSSVEGWAGSGSIVDVLLIAKDRTSVVAERVKILSAERSTSPVKGVAPANVPSTVTLLVTQEQCLAINTAIPLGKMAFALRSAGDENDWRDTAFTADRLRGSTSGVASPESSVTGYAALVDRKGKTKHQFALSGGKWLKTQVVPDGFFARKPPEGARQEPQQAEEIP